MCENEDRIMQREARERAIMVEKERVNNVSEIIIQETHLKKRAFGAQSALLSSISEGRCERGLRDERIDQSMSGELDAKPMSQCIRDGGLEETVSLRKENS